MARYIIVLSTAAALIHGLFAGPLLVRCIPADGQAVVEMLGHDPHQISNPCSSSGSFEAPEPDCIDLFLESSAILNPAMSLEHFSPYPEILAPASPAASPSVGVLSRGHAPDCSAGLALRI